MRRGWPGLRVHRRGGREGLCRIVGEMNDPLGAGVVERIVDVGERGGEPVTFGCRCAQRLVAFGLVAAQLAETVVCLRQLGFRLLATAAGIVEASLHPLDLLAVDPAPAVPGDRAERLLGLVDQLRPTPGCRGGARPATSRLGLRRWCVPTEPPRGGQKSAEVHTWDAPTLRRFLDASRSEDDRLYALWVLLATTGMRRGEALGLRWADLDLDKGRARVVQTILQTRHPGDHRRPEDRARPPVDRPGPRDRRSTPRS